MAESEIAIDKTTPQVTPQALEIYKARLAQVDFVKKQQWVVTNYAVLIYAAIAWVAKNSGNPISPILLWSLSGVVIVVQTYAIVLLVWFQFDLEKARNFLDKANAYCFNKDQRKPLGLEDFPNPFGRGWNVLLALILVCFVGAAITFAFLHTL